MTASALKYCSCKEHGGPNPLPLSSFGKDSSRADGHKYWCKACRSKESQRRYQVHPDRVKRSNLRWRQAEPEKVDAINKRYRDRLRDRVFDHYGRICICCGATDDLTIDHATSSGGLHRVEIFGRRKDAGLRFYAWLVRHNFPEGYAVLCRRCNASKHTGERCALDHTAAAS